MKKILLAISSLFLLVGCSTYNVGVKDDIQYTVEINGKEVKPGECKEYSDSLFGLLGDFPLSIKVGDREPKNYPAGNYFVTGDGDDGVQSTDEPCEVKDTDEENPDDKKDPDKEGDTASSEEDVTDNPAESASGASGSTGQTQGGLDPAEEVKEKSWGSPLDSN